MAKRATKINMTDRWLRALRNKPHPGEPRLIFFYDGTAPGLNLLWTPSTLSWGMTKRWPGGSQNPSWRSLGAVYIPPKDEKTEEKPVTAGALTLGEAREKARRWLDLLARGIDPAQQERKRKLEADKRTTWPTFREAFLKYYEGKAKHSEAKRILTNDFACWNDRSADEIDAGNVESAIQAIVDRGAKYQAINAFGYIRTMYNWALGRPSLRIKASPCASLSTKTLIGKKRPRTHVIGEPDIRSIWNGCGAPGYLYPYGQSPAFFG
jgi:hypothetical protein